jgi:photosystem II oxygen-evolving enhancer protein 2
VLATAEVVLCLTKPSMHVAAPKGFNPYEDRSDGYKFLYPFGWQEVAVKGTDIVFKDIVEPLESVSVTLTTTERKDITEFGDIQEVGPGEHNPVLNSTLVCRQM